MDWYWLVAISAFLFAISSVMRKHVLNHEHALEQLAAEAPFKLAILIFFIPFLEKIHPEEMILIFIVSIVLVTTLYYRNRAYRHMPISVIAPLHNLSPIILLVIAFFLLGERPSIEQMLGIGLVIFGGYTLELRSNDLLSPLKKFKANKYWGVVVTVLILLSLLATLDKTMLNTMKIPMITYLFWLQLFATLISVGVDYQKYRLKGVKEDIKKGWYWLMLISILSITSIVFLFEAFSTPGVLVALAIPIRRTATLIETLIGGSLFHEKDVWRKAAGCFIMVLGVVFIV